MNKKLFTVIITVVLVCSLTLMIYGRNLGVVFKERQTTSHAVTAALTEETELSSQAETETESEAETETKAESTTDKAERTTSKERQTATKASEKTTAAAETATEKITYVTVTVECTSILSNINRLAEGHSEYVPASGYILSNYKIDYVKGDTAYDALKKACSQNGISISAKETSYGVYVSGINNLDEFDCGLQSGWLYYVNENSPSYSCGKYKLSPGDSIRFSYTCNG